MDANAQEKPGEGDADVSAGRNDAGQTAGQMLRDAREQAGYHLPALAANLKVSVQKLEALEANDWSVFPDVVFTRALASTVCRVLKIDAAPVLALLPKAPGQELRKGNDGVKAQVVGGSASAKGADFSSSKPFPWMVVVVLLAVATAGVLFYPQLSARWAQQSATSTAANTARSGNVAGSAEGGESVALGGTTNVGEADAAGGANASAPAAGAGAASPVAGADASVLGAVPAAGMPVASPDATAAEVPVLKVKAAKDSWVQVKDSTGKVVFEKTVKAGSEQEVVATPPLKVVIGNAVGVELLLRGEAFDLKKVTKGTTARFEVN